MWQDASQVTLYKIQEAALLFYKNSQWSNYWGEKQEHRVNAKTVQKKLIMYVIWNKTILQTTLESGYVKILLTFLFVRA